MTWPEVSFVAFLATGGGRHLPATISENAVAILVGWIEVDGCARLALLAKSLTLSEVHSGSHLDIGTLFVSPNVVMF